MKVFPMSDRLVKTVILLSLAAGLLVVAPWLPESVSQADAGPTVPSDTQPLRLHIIPDTNQRQDQHAKLIVRSALLERLNPVVQREPLPASIMQWVSRNQNTLNQVLETVLLENGYRSTVDVQVGYFLFPAATDGTVMLPPGEYPAIRVEIGHAQGKNWWCVLYPGLCFQNAATWDRPQKQPAQSYEVRLASLAWLQQFNTPQRLSQESFSSNH